MISREIEQLAQQGRDFRREAFTQEFMLSTKEHVLQAPDYIIGQYALTRQYHATPVAHLAGIQNEGLRPGVALFDRSDEDFFRLQYAEQQQRVRRHADDRLVEKYIFGRDDGRSRGVYTAHDTTDGHMRAFAIPEATRFFLRNMNALSNLPEASDNARDHARNLVAKYTGRLVADSQIEVALLAVDPMSPQLANAVIHPYDFEAFGPDFCLPAIQLDQKDTMTEIIDTIPSKYLTLQSMKSYAAEPLIDWAVSSTGQVVFVGPPPGKL